MIQGASYNSVIKCDLSKNEKAKIFSNPKPFVSHNYGDTNQFPVHQSGKHQTAIYSYDIAKDKQSGYSVPNSNLMNVRPFAPPVMKQNSLNYENSYTSSSSYLNPSASNSDSYQKYGDAQAARKVHNAVFTSRSNNIGIENSLELQDKTNTYNN